MNGREKFLRAFQISFFKRTYWLLCNKTKYKEIEHKYIGGRWPQIMIAPDPSLIRW